MFRRFAAGSAVASVVIGIAALVVVLLPAEISTRFFPVLRVWCFVPLAWGLWVMLAPDSWVPARLPLWGAILGVIAGVLAIFVLDLPSRVAGAELPTIGRAFGMLVPIAGYYLLWMLVRMAYRSLTPPA